MKKITLSILALYIGVLAVFSQTKPSSDSAYRQRKLTFAEANIVSSYYSQDGNNSAITGGIGTEKLTDFSNSFSIKLTRVDKKWRKHSFDAELGIDNYTSASSDRIDMKANSSASYNDTRIYPSLNWTMEDDKKGLTWGAGASASREFDYYSFGSQVNVAKKTKNRMGEFGIKLFTYLDNLKLIYPVELRTGAFIPRGEDYPMAARNTFGSSFSYNQIINAQLQISILADVILQQGYLSLPFHRVYFSDNSVHLEQLPDSRLKLPISIRASYFAGDHLIFRGYYRYYQDDWGMTAHTISLEPVIKPTAFFSVSPFYRFYSQQATKYFAPYQQHTAANTYYTSNFDLSTFTSHFYGAGLRIAPPNGILGWQHLGALELRYGHYSRSNNMQSDIVTLNLTIK